MELNLNTCAEKIILEVGKKMFTGDSVKTLVKIFLENHEFTCLNLENINTEITAKEFEDLTQGYSEKYSKYSYEGFIDQVEEYCYTDGTKKVKLIFVYDYSGDNKIVLKSIYAYRY